MGQQAPKFDQGLDDSQDMFFSTAKEQKLVEQLQDELKKSIHACFPSCEKLAEVIEFYGLPVISKGPELHLKLAMMLVGVRPGFVPPTHPRYEDFVKTLLSHMPDKAHLDFSQGMLLCLKENYHFPSLAYELYHWRACQSGLPGYREIDRKNFEEMNNKYAGKPVPKFLDKLDLNQAVGLRNSIRRDREAWQFIRKMMHEVFIPKNNAKLIESGDAQA